MLSNNDKIVQDAINAVESLTSQRADISRDIADIFATLKGNGYTPMQIRAIKETIRLRKLNAQDREDLTAFIEQYSALHG